MMSSNSYSTDPADDFPEVDDYSEVDELDVVAAELAAELGAMNGNGATAPAEAAASEADSPEMPASETAASETSASEMTSADLTTPEGLAAALAEQVGLDLNGDSPLASGPVDLTEQGFVDDEHEHPATARAGWFPPEADQNGSGDRGDFGANAPERDPAQGAFPIADERFETVGQPSMMAPGDTSDEPRPQHHELRPPSEGFGETERPPSSPPIERAPVAPQPPAQPTAAPPAQANRADAGATAGRPIDQVAVRKLGGFNFLSIGQWSALPRDERARLVKGGLVMFLFEGEEVPARAALTWLKQMAQAESAGLDDRPTRRRGR